MTSPTDPQNPDLASGGIPASIDQPPAASEPPAADPSDATPRTPEEYAAEIAKLRKENANWRTKLREAEPKAKAFDEVQDAQKTEAQRANDRALAAEQKLTDRERELNVLRAAAKYGIPEEDHDLLGSGTPEELDTRAARLSAMRQSSAPTPPPPSDRPVEGLRPGASPTPPTQADTSYPTAWRPSGLPERS